MGRVTRSVAILAAALVLLSVWTPPTAAARPSPSAEVVLGAGVATGVTESPSTLWAVRQFSKNAFSPDSLPWLNQTPFSVVRYGAFCDDSNYTSGLSYNASGVSSPLDMNWSSIAAYFALSHRAWIFCVGGETNNAGSVANQVEYIVDTLGLHPTYWSIGNEPMSWTHFNIPFSSWLPTDDSVPTPAQYALTVENCTRAMRAVDPGIQVVGIQSGAAATAEGPWIHAVVADNGPNLTAVAVHLYVDGKGTEAQSASQFLAAGNLSKIAYAVTSSIQNVSTACASCQVPVWIDEFNAYSGPTGQADGLPVGYPMVPFTAAGIVEALSAGARQFTFFDLEDMSGNYSLVNGTSGVPRPAFDLFSGILEHMVVGAVELAPISGAPSGVYDVEMKSGNTTSLLVVDTNTSLAVDVSVASATAGAVGGAVYSMSNASQSPTGEIGALPSSISVGPLGVTLFTWWGPLNGSAPSAPAVAIAGPVDVPLGTALVVALAVLIAAVAVEGSRAPRSRRRRVSRQR